MLWTPPFPRKPLNDKRANHSNVLNSNIQYVLLGDGSCVRENMIQIGQTIIFNLHTH